MLLLWMGILLDAIDVYVTFKIMINNNNQQSSSGSTFSVEPENGSSIIDTMQVYFYCLKLLAINLRKHSHMNGDK